MLERVLLEMASQQTEAFFHCFLVSIERNQARVCAEERVEVVGPRFGKLCNAKNRLKRTRGMQRVWKEYQSKETFQLKMSKKKTQKQINIQHEGQIYKLYSSVKARHVTRIKLLFGKYFGLLTYTKITM